MGDSVYIRVYKQQKWILAHQAKANGQKDVEDSQNVMGPGGEGWFAKWEGT